MYRYLTYKENLQSSELGHYISFGIKVFDSSNCEVTSVSDVSVDQTLVENLCDVLTLYQVEPVHLMNIIEDFIFI